MEAEQNYYSLIQIVLTYEIEMEDVYKDLWKRKELSDNSDYPKGSPYEFQENKKVIGKFKDES